MIYPKKNPLIHWFFHHYIRYIIKHNFHDVVIKHEVIDLSGPLLLLGNHFSWWDGFLLYHLNDYLLKKKFHIMILEETVLKVAFMKYMGAFSIKKHSRSVIDSLNYASQLLNPQQNMVVIFPQGKLYSNFVDEVVFEKGLEKIIKQANSSLQVGFAVTFVENFKYKKPVANIYFKTVPKMTASELMEAYQEFYQKSKAHQIQISY
jgi:1-acyl-sn-glycerol-3-phosphate acyltransferase